MNDLAQRIDQLQKELDGLREEVKKPGKIGVRVSPERLYFGRFLGTLEHNGAQGQKRMLLVTNGRFFAFKLNGVMAHYGDFSVLPYLGEKVEISPLYYVFDREFNLDG